MIKCPACGHENADTNNFCANCGHALLANESTGDTTRVVAAVDVPDEAAGEDLSADDLSAINQLRANSALLIERQGPSAGARFLVNSDVTTAGRHPRCDIFLDDITVSRHHAKFVRSAGKLYLEDLGSLNGTYVNRTLLDGRTVLREGDEIQIGKYRATISLSEPGLS